LAGNGGQCAGSRPDPKTPQDSSPRNSSSPFIRCLTRRHSGYRRVNNQFRILVDGTVIRFLPVCSSQLTLKRFPDDSWFMIRKAVAGMCAGTTATRITSCPTMWHLAVAPQAGARAKLGLRFWPEPQGQRVLPAIGTTAPQSQTPRPENRRLERTLWRRSGRPALEDAFTIRLSPANTSPTCCSSASSRPRSPGRCI